MASRGVRRISVSARRRCPDRFHRIYTAKGKKTGFCTEARPIGYKPGEFHPPMAFVDREPNLMDRVRNAANAAADAVQDIPMADTAAAPAPEPAPAVAPDLDPPTATVVTRFPRVPPKYERAHNNLKKYLWFTSKGNYRIRKPAKHGRFSYRALTRLEQELLAQGRKYHVGTQKRRGKRCPKGTRVNRYNKRVCGQVEPIAF